MSDQTPTTRAQMTVDEYFMLPETTQPSELIHGEVIMSPAPTTEHQRISGVLYRLLISLMPNGELFYAPTDVVFAENMVFQPDIFWISDNGHCVEKEGRFYGSPDLIVEVLSPSSARHDKTVKFLAYEKAGVSEYWLVDPSTRLVEVWHLQEDEYVLIGSYGTDATFASPLLEKNVSLVGVFA